jgi:hypothetical protein
MDDEKEKKRKKQYKRMGKILGSLWELDEGTNYFQERPPDYQENDDEYVLCLSDIGKKIDSKTYRLGRHGWEDFAKDVGGVYNFHIKIRYVSRPRSVFVERCINLVELMNRNKHDLVITSSRDDDESAHMIGTGYEKPHSIPLLLLVRNVYPATTNDAVKVKPNPQVLPRKVWILFAIYCSRSKSLL